MEVATCETHITFFNSLSSPTGLPVGPFFDRCDQRIATGNCHGALIGAFEEGDKRLKTSRGR